uniref:RRM domain-containing protein n=1 Tax=Anopheles minimus TaxID=112268 RepID=A0A182W0N8_9DIPT
METVRVFNQELSGLYESKPPISKAKMASITRSAMKAIKFYKHVVQSVEKFIQKCKCEYKIPGLYVIDSIVRQSRHQFGPEKDVFAPRFARNMESTFAHLFRCPPEDKSKIIRVLNLWQKNMVFLPEVIQPLFDLANPDHPIHQQYNAQVLQEQVGANGMNPGGLPHDSPIGGSMGGGMDDHGNQLQMGETKQLDPSTIRQLQQFQQILMRQTSGDQAGGAVSKDQVKFNKKLLDFDYGSDDDDDKNSPSIPLPGNTGMPDLSQMPGGNIAQILSDPNVLKQLQNLQKLKQQDEKQTKLSEMLLKEEKFEKHLASVLMKLPFANECDLSRQPPIDLNAGHSKDVDTDNDVAITGVEILGDPLPIGSSRGGIGLGSSGTAGGSGNNDRYKSSSSSSRRKSRSRSPRDRRGGGSGTGGRGGRGRSHSRSRSASPRSSRRRSSRDRGGTSTKDREREKEHERERKRKGLPEMKKEHLSVCSTTLWVGHLSKLVQQEELSDTFGKYGDIVSIDMIPPRGCAFIVMNRRQDAFKSMQSLKNHKMHGRTITISWAAGKGVKSKEWKDYWDLDLGVSYIPWSKLSPSTDLESLEDGGMFDEDTMPQWMKEKSSVGGTAVGLGSAAAAAAAAMGLTLAPGMNLKKLDGTDLSTAAAAAAAAAAAGMLNPSLFPLSAVDTSQPPPTAMMGMGMPPFQMGPVARLPIPMGIPMGPNMVAGLGMNVPPPGMMLSGNPPPLPMGGFGVLPPPPPSSSGAASGMIGNGGGSANMMSSSMSKSSADDMDIEMEDEHSSNPAPMVGGGQSASAFFNQPPPPLMPPSAANLPPGPPGNAAGFFGAGAGNLQDNGGPLDVGSDDAEGEPGMGRGGRDFLRANDDGRDHLRGRGGDRNRERDQRGGGAGFDRGVGGDGGARRERGERGSRWGGGGGNNFRGGDGANNQQDDRPLSERLRELAGVLEFNNQQQRGGGAGGRNFGRGGFDGEDFGNREGDFSRRGGNFQQNRFNNNNAGGNGDGGGRNMGRNGPFGNQQQGGGGRGGNGGGMFGNRAGGGRNNNQQQQRGGQFFNDDRQQGAFFDRDEGSNGYDSGGNNGNNSNNRRNWNERAGGGGRGNNGNNRDDVNRGRGRQQNWRSGDESAGSGGDGGGGGGQRFNNARGGNNNRNAGGNRPGGVARWDDDDESWDDANNRSTTGRPAQFSTNRQRRNSEGNEEQDQQQHDPEARQNRREGGPSETEDMTICDEQSRHSEHDSARDMRDSVMNRQGGEVENAGDRRFQRNHHHRNDDADDERPQPILYSPEPEEELDQTNNNNQFADEDNGTYRDEHNDSDKADGSFRNCDMEENNLNRMLPSGDEHSTNINHPQEETSEYRRVSEERFEGERDDSTSAANLNAREEANDFSHNEREEENYLPAGEDRDEAVQPPPSATSCQEQNEDSNVQSNDTEENDAPATEPVAC